MSRASPKPGGRTAAGSARGTPPDPAQASASRPCLLAEQAAAQPPGGDIDDEDGEDDRDQDRADVGVIELADRHHELLADTAGADKTHHRRLAHIDLEPQ